MLGVCECVFLGRGVREGKRKGKRESESRLSPKVRRGEGALPTWTALARRPSIPTAEMGFQRKAASPRFMLIDMLYCAPKIREIREIQLDN